MMPRHLLECDERQRMALMLCLVRRTGGSYQSREFRLQQDFCQLPRSERDIPPDDFGAIVAGQANRSDLPCNSIGVQLNGPCHIHRTVRKEDRLFSQTRKFSKEVRPYSNRSMRLAAKRRNAACYFHVGTRTIGAAERVAWQHPGRRV